MVVFCCGVRRVVAETGLSRFRVSAGEVLGGPGVTSPDDDGGGDDDDDDDGSFDLAGTNLKSLDPGRGTSTPHQPRSHVWGRAPVTWATVLLRHALHPQHRAAVRRSRRAAAATASGGTFWILPRRIACAWRATRRGTAPDRPAGMSPDHGRG